MQKKKSAPQPPVYQVHARHTHALRADYNKDRLKALEEEAFWRGRAVRPDPDYLEHPEVEVECPTCEQMFSITEHLLLYTFEKRHGGWEIVKQKKGWSKLEPTQITKQELDVYCCNFYGHSGHSGL